MPFLKIRPLSKTAYDFYKNHGIYHIGDSGLDLFVTKDVIFNPGETKLIDLEIQCEMYDDTKNISYYLYPRSSISKTPLRMANSIGIIDAGYRGNIKTAMTYVPTCEFLSTLKTTDLSIFEIMNTFSYTVKKGDRLVQICAPNLQPFNFVIVNKLSKTKRGKGGFGSTGNSITISHD